MKHLSIPVAAALALFVLSCSKPGYEPEPAVGRPAIRIKATDVRTAALDADAVEFYKDVAVLAEWYADHPTVLKAEIEKNRRLLYTDSSYNNLIGKFEELRVFDANDKPVSFFELSETARHAFLKDYVKLESKTLDDKFKLAANEQIDDHIEQVNATVDQTINAAPFSDTFDFNAEAARIKSSNPYQQINQNLQRRLGNAAPPLTTNERADEQPFFKTLADLGILRYSLITFNPIATNNTPQRFVDNMRSHLRRGLVLVALPGGFVTGTPLAFNGIVFDVGHVAIVSKDASSIPSQINRDYKLTIGTNSGEGMHHEGIHEDWTSKHGMSYLMKPVRVTYHYKAVFGLLPWYEKQEEDVDHAKTYEKITEALGRPYCRLDQMAYAKWAAPERFICSSSAWWAIKAAHGIGIGDLYKPTIFPAGVYESGDMRVVARTY